MTAIWVLEITFDPEGYETNSEIIGAFDDLDVAKRLFPDALEWKTTAPIYWYADFGSFGPNPRYRLSLEQVEINTLCKSSMDYEAAYDNDGR